MGGICESRTCSAFKCCFSVPLLRPQDALLTAWDMSWFPLLWYEWGFKHSNTIAFPVLHTFVFIIFIAHTIHFLLLSSHQPTSFSSSFVFPTLAPTAHLFYPLPPFGSLFLLSSFWGHPLTTAFAFSKKAVEAVPFWAMVQWNHTAENITVHTAESHRL